MVRLSFRRRTKSIIIAISAVFLSVQCFLMSRIAKDVVFTTVLPSRFGWIMSNNVGGVVVVEQQEDEGEEEEEEASTGGSPPTFCGGGGSGHPRPPYYGIVVDAASSGSRIRIFSWDNAIRSSSVMTEVVPDADEEDLFEITPGLSSYAPSGIGAGESLSGLMEASKRLIPQSHWGTTPLYVYATAGMRLLDPNHATAVLEDTERYLHDQKKCPFDVREVNIISGREEAFYAFLSVNDHDLSSSSPSPHHDWKGLIDLGGASLQLAYPLEDPLADPMRNVSDFVFEIANRSRYKQGRIQIVAVSYLRFGLDVALSRYKDSLVLAAAAAADTVAASEDGTERHVINVTSPCHNPMYREVYETADGRNFTLHGSGNGTLCLEKSMELLYLHEHCKTEGCPTIATSMEDDGKQRPPPPPPPGMRGDFYAISAFFYGANDLGLVDWSGSVALEPLMLFRAALEYCALQKPWQEVRERRTCFKTIYSSALLFAFFGGYGQRRKHDGGLGEVTFTRRIGGRNADWTMGALLHAREVAKC